MKYQPKQLRVFSTPDEVASRFAENLAEFISRVVLKKGVVNIALSGGNTPRFLFKKLADKFGHTLPWDRVHFFWSDERCVPPEHEESNYQMTKDNLLKHINIPFENIHRIHGDRDPEDEARRYSSELKRLLPQENNWPVFDLIILGMGEDGHTASIFPNQMNLLQSDRICEVAIHPFSRQKRITVTGRVINHALEVCFLVTGKNKAKRLKEIFLEEDISLNYPAAHINPEDREIYWYLDEEAISEISWHPHLNQNYE